MSDYYDKTEKEHSGHTVTIKWFHDAAMGEPWKEHDGHGIDSDSQGEFQEEVIEEAIEWIDKELSGAQDAACRDIATA